MEELENSKENYRPLVRGRVVNPACEAEKPVLNEQTTRDADDPLETWERYIKWAQLNVKSGSSNADLIDLFERCTQDIQKHRNYERYKTDPRFLRIWVQYADCCTDPKEIFDYLEHHNIGQNLALFYEARAAFQELKGAFADAHSTYDAGLARQAQPKERLRVKFINYQARMVKRIQRSIDSGQGNLHSSRERERSFRVTQGTAAIAPAQPQRSGQQPAHQMPSAQASAGGGGFEIFSDDSVPGGAPPVSQPAPQWTHLGTQKAKSKENQMQPSAWAGVRLSGPTGASAAAAAAPPAGAADFVVFEDERADEPEPAPPQSMAALLRLDGGGPLALRPSDIPLGLSRPLAPFPTLPASHESAAPPAPPAVAVAAAAVAAAAAAVSLKRKAPSAAAAAAPAPVPGEEAWRGCDPEVSFEEHRAKRWRSCPPPAFEAEEAPLAEEEPMDLCGNTVAFPALRKDFFLSRSAATAPAAPAPAPSPAALPLPPLPEAAAAQTPLTERTQPVLVEERTETVPPALAEPSATPATVPAAEGRAFTPAGTATQPPTETAAARGHETPLSAAPRGFPLGRASSTFKPVLSPEATPAAPTPAPAATPAAEAAAAAGGATPGALEVFSPGLSTAQPVALRFSPMAPQAQAPAQATPVAPAGPAPLPLPLSPVDCGDPSDAGEGEAEESASAPAPPPLPAPPAPPAAEVTEAAPFAGFQFQSLSPVVELAEGTSAEPSPLNFQKPAEAAAAHVEAAPFPVPAAASPAPAALGSAAAAVTPAAAAVAASDFVFDSQLKGTMHGTAEAASSVSPEAFFAMRFDAASARSAQIALTPAAAAASPAAPAAEPAAAPSPCPSADGNADILAELWGASSSSFGAAASPLPQVATSPQQPSPAQADAADGVSAAAGPGHWQPSPSEGPAPPPESGADLQPCSSDAPAAPDVHTDSEVELGQGPSGGSGSGGGFVEAPYGESSYRVMNGFEPTVTVNMREAMSDIYSMFQDDLPIEAKKPGLRSSSGGVSAAVRGAEPSGASCAAGPYPYGGPIPEASFAVFEEEDGEALTRGLEPLRVGPSPGGPGADASGPLRGGSADASVSFAIFADDSTSQLAAPLPQATEVGGGEGSFAAGPGDTTFSFVVYGDDDAPQPAAALAAAASTAAEATGSFTVFEDAQPSAAAAPSPEGKGPLATSFEVFRDEPSIQLVEDAHLAFGAFVPPQQAPVAPPIAAAPSAAEEEAREPLGVMEAVSEPTEGAEGASPQDEEEEEEAPAIDLAALDPAPAALFSPAAPGPAPGPGPLGVRSQSAAVPQTEASPLPPPPAPPCNDTQGFVVFEDTCALQSFLQADLAARGADVVALAAGSGGAAAGAEAAADEPTEALAAAAAVVPSSMAILGFSSWADFDADADFD